ncbi:MAG: agmatine deiminase family protein [Phycisphaerae bacterium]|nr:agmatine deiminase family protein [Phycisphaerae bacterium]
MRPGCIRTTVLCAAAGLLSIVDAARAQTEPFERDGVLVFPPDAAIPRFMTQAERAFWVRNPPPPPGGRGIATPPTGPVRCVAEYEPMQGILVSWIGSSSWLTILAQMGAQITTIGNADYDVIVPNAATQSSATSLLNGAGANMSRVKFFTRTLDTIWIRDYGPRYIYQGNCRAIVDHTYNRPRPNDDAFSQWWGPQRKQPVYDIPLVHGGGNYHLNALGKSYATRLIANENASLTEAQIIAYWQSYQSVDTHLFNAFPTSVDSTQHLDMWMQVLGDNKVVVSDWPANSGSTQDVICDNAAAYMQSQGYTVYRVPARQVSGTHYTYTNVVMCNDLLLLPTYTNSTVVNAGYNAQALSTWKTAWGDTGTSARKVVQVDCQAIVTSAGVMHCIVMHVPVPLGGVNPTAYIKSLNAAQTLTPGQTVSIDWITDDDVSVSNVDVLLSRDGGATFPITIAAATADDGTQTWTVPDFYTPKARVKVVARDGGGRTGWDVNDADLIINSSRCRGDYNLDGSVDDFDLFDFLNDFNAENPAADFNGDASVDDFDYFDFLNALGGPC